MKAGDCRRRPGVLISSPCLSHHQETNHVPLKTSATPTGWLHGCTSEDIWRTKWKRQKLCRKAHFSKIGMAFLYACACICKSHIDLNFPRIQIIWMQRELCIQQVYPAYLRCKFSVRKAEKTVFEQKISKHLWPQLQWGISLFRKWKRYPGIVIILRVSPPLTL